MGSSRCRCQESGAQGGDGVLASLREATLAAELPSSPLASFPAIFKQSLALGTLSRRRVLQRANAYQVPAFCMGVKGARQQARETIRAT